MKQNTTTSFNIMSQSTLKSTLIELRIPDVLIDLIDACHMHRSLIPHRNAEYLRHMFFVTFISSAFDRIIKLRQNQFIGITQNTVSPGEYMILSLLTRH